MGRGDPVKLGDRLGVAAGEQAGTGTGHGDPQEVEGIAEEHQAAPPAPAEPAEKVAERLVVGELVAEPRPPGLGGRASAEVEVTDDDERRFGHRSITSSRFSRKWPVTAPLRQRVRYTTTL